MKNPTDLELDAAFAEKVAGWMQCERLGRMVWYDPEGGHEINPPRFTQSADLVLPWLEKHGWRGTSNRAGSTCAASVEVNDRTATGLTFIAQQDFRHTQTPFPRAAVIALLFSHGIEIEFT